MSTLKVNTIQNASGVEVYTAKAWVNFNGTGTVAIRASGNVSSITDNGTGDYTVNFTNAMSDANYAVYCSTEQYNAAGAARSYGLYSTATSGGGEVVSTTAVRTLCWASSGALDETYLFVAIFR